MNFQLSLEKKINKFGQKAKILDKKVKVRMKSEKKGRFMSGRDAPFFSFFRKNQIFWKKGAFKTKITAQDMV